MERTAPSVGKGSITTVIVAPALARGQTTLFAPWPAQFGITARIMPSLSLAQLNTDAPASAEATGQETTAASATLCMIKTQIAPRAFQATLVSPSVPGSAFTMIATTGV